MDAEDLAAADRFSGTQWPGEETLGLTAAPYHARLPLVGCGIRNRTHSAIVPNAGVFSPEIGAGPL